MDLKIGDSVMHSREFLRSIGIYTGNVPFAVGTIIDIRNYGSFTLATVDWKDSTIPERINVNNLVRKDRIPYEKN